MRGGGGALTCGLTMTNSCTYTFITLGCKVARHKSNMSLISAAAVAHFSVV